MTSQFQASLDGVNEAFKRLQNENEQFKKLNSESSVRIKELSSKVNRLESENDRLISQNDRLASENALLERNRGSLRSSVSEQARHESETKCLKSAICRLEDRLKCEKNKSESDIRKLESKLSRLNDVIAENEQISKEKTEISARHEQLFREKEQLARRGEELSTRIAELREENGRLSKQSEEQFAKNEILSAKNSELSSKIGELSNSNQILTRRNLILISRNQDLEVRMGEWETKRQASQPKSRELKQLDSRTDAPAGQTNELSKCRNCLKLEVEIGDLLGESVRTLADGANAQLQQVKEFEAKVSKYLPAAKHEFKPLENFSLDRDERPNQEIALNVSSSSAESPSFGISSTSVGYELNAAPVNPTACPPVYPFDEFNYSNYFAANKKASINRMFEPEASLNENTPEEEDQRCIETLKKINKKITDRKSRKRPKY